MTIKKSRNFNFRIDDQLLDKIEKIAIEKFDENTSGALRFVAELGIKFFKLKPLEITKEKIEELTNEMKQQVKNETFFEALDSFTPEQQGAIKSHLMRNEEAREKQQS